MSVLECEEKGLEKLRRIQLPNGFKKIGIIAIITAFAMLVINKIAIDSELLRSVLKHMILVGLLVISLSKEKIEDERIVNLRAKSFMLAFLIGVVFALLMPVASYLIDIILGNVPTSYESVGDFVILWQLLTMQIISFELFKRKSA